ncbi:MAG TPA: transglutaminase-like domain-containing protein [Fervidobacterium sp.]|nr:transglutaminase [Fervidobacterium sp.]HOK87498.1 transglutaminase-like domain-containing protein [Fervidobacterium sp.]HOM73901.1 transglutaminase-like domain-containing protein [Fervidobacterium sp.]HPP17632.1 transglutaminase-like domain-containing protein [Fervidobacterium sp.]HRD19608.1 transglutaminase-like domain-containing protein [Fervidobacterium sp.]
MEFLVYPLPEDIRRQVTNGLFSTAQNEIKKRLEEHKLPDAMTKRLLFELYRIKLLKKTYPYTEKEAYALLKKGFKDITKEEFQRLVRDGRIDWMYVGDVKMFEKRFDSNLVFSSKEYKARQKLTKESREGSKRRKLINDTIGRLLKGGKSRTYNVHAKISMKKDNPENERVRVWLPFPKEAFQQSSVKLVKSSHEHFIADNLVGQRTVYMEGIDTDEFSIEFEYNVKEWIGTEKNLEPQPEEKDTSEKLPHINFTEYLWSILDIIFGCQDYMDFDDLTRARKIYDFVTLNVSYSYVLPYALYDNIPEYVTTVFKGDCGFQALLFLTLCRMTGIPAKWQSGWSITPLSASPHDWTLIYLEGLGWVPVDLSFGGSRRDDESMRLFYFTNLDGFRMFANTEFQDDLVPSKHSWRLDPYDNQVGEMEYADIDKGYILDVETKIEVIDFKQV